MDSTMYNKLDSLVDIGKWERKGNVYLFDIPLDVVYEKINFKEYTFSVQLIKDYNQAYFFLKYDQAY